VAKVTVIDAGSNAIRLAIAKDKGPDFELLYKHRESIRLGNDVFSQGKISDELLFHTVNAFKRFKKISEEYKSDNIKAIATSAMREGSGIQLDVISGERESDLVFKAIRHQMDLKKDNALLIDIGGGSVELVAVQKGDIVKAKSFPLGTVRLLNSLKDDVVAYHSPIKAIEGKLTEAINLGIGGNIERMGKVNTLLTGKDSNKLVTLPELIKMYDTLTPFSVGKRMKEFDLKSDQADVIVPAIALCIHFMQFAFAQNLHIPSVGIKDGLILEELKILR